MSDTKIQRDDIKSKLVDIGDGVTNQAEEAKTQIVAVAAGVGLLLLILFFFLGRKNGLKRSAVIEIRRS
ncbi:MAG: hypothetical protein R2754_05615 [Microthrixaceae bacterium]|jgi:hypothetical protein